MPLISLCLIVRNEARDLPRCLASVAGLVSELIVVDTGSTDETPAIAQAHGAILLRHRWADDFAEARNVALAHATGDWILHLDADEELEAASRPLIHGLLCESPAAGLRLRVRSLLPPQDPQQYEDDWIVRLFRRLPGLRYQGRLHEQIRPAIEQQGGRILDADLTILHHGYAQPTAQGTDRRHRNLAQLDRMLTAAPDDPYLHYHRGATLHALGQHAAATAALQHALALGAADLGDGVRIRLYRRLAQLALAAEEYPTALEHAATGLAEQPDDLLCLWVAALARMFQGHVTEALPLFQQVRRAPTLQPAWGRDLDAVLAACENALQKSLRPIAEPDRT
jgi:tetratricopeptide (TPR) repeat protein